MFCSKCGKEIPDDSKFCTFCGNTILPVTGNDNQANMQFSQPQQNVNNSQPSTSGGNYKKPNYMKEWIVGLAIAFVVIIAVILIIASTYSKSTKKVIETASANEEVSESAEVTSASSSEETTAESKETSTESAETSVAATPTIAAIPYSQRTEDDWINDRENADYIYENGYLYNDTNPKITGTIYVWITSADNSVIHVIFEDTPDVVDAGDKYRSVDLKQNTSYGSSEGFYTLDDGILNISLDFSNDSSGKLKFNIGDEVSYMNYKYDKAMLMEMVYTLTTINYDVSSAATGNSSDDFSFLGTEGQYSNGTDEECGVITVRLNMELGKVQFDVGTFDNPEMFENCEIPMIDEKTASGYFGADLSEISLEWTDAGTMNVTLNGSSGNAELDKQLTGTYWNSSMYAP